MVTSPSTEITESDQRLPSGQWSGFYLESHQPKRGWMHVYMQFRDGKIAGEGTDYVGPWTIRGVYDLYTSRAQWTKQYVGKHQVVYEGAITEHGIQGEWNIRGWLNGLFHIWPRQRHDLEMLYLSDEQEGHPPTMLAGTVPIPPSDAL